MRISGHTTREAETVAFFEKKYGKVYTIEEARLISERLTEGFMLLRKWAIEQKVFETTNQGTRAGRKHEK